MTGGNVNLDGLADPNRVVDLGIPHSKLMIMYTDALVKRDKVAIKASRDALVEAIGAEATVDAAGVISNYTRTVRVSDGTGVPVDAPIQVMSEDLREELKINEFDSAEKTKNMPFIKRMIMKRLVPVMFRKMVKKSST